MTRHGWARRLIHGLEYNPRLQFRFHLVAIIFWIVNVFAATSFMILDPHEWTRFAVYYVLLLSLYANADTDYDAMTASLAAMHSGDLLEESRAAAVSVIVSGICPHCHEPLG